jgi:hypothetical protein
VLSRRDALKATVSAIALYSSMASGQQMFVVGQGGPTTWQTLPIGAGGFITGLDIASDGTKVIRTDTYGGYWWNGTRWVQLITNANFAALVPGLTAISSSVDGIYEIKIAPSLTTRFAMIFLNKVYRSDDRGVTWNDSNLSMTNALANAGSSRLAQSKLCIDPNNPDHVFVGLPNGSTPNTGVYETFNFGNATPTWTNVASITAPSVAPGCAGMLFDGSSGTTTVGGHTVTARCLICSAGNGVYETLNGGSTWTLTTGTPTILSAAQIGPTGSYYAAAGTANANITVMRYLSGAWANICPSGFSGVYFAALGNGVCCADPTTPGTLTITGPNGGWYGYQTTNADAGSVTWNGSTGGQTHTQTSTDIPWMAHGDTSFASVGNLVVDPSDGFTYFAEGIGVWKFTSLNYKAGGSYNVVAVSMSLGIEQLVSNDITAPLGANPIYACWDRGVIELHPPTYPTNYFPTPSVTHCWALDWASSDPTFICALAYFSGAGHSGSSNSSGATGTWAPFTTQPTSNQGGCIAAATPLNMVAVVAGTAVPVYTTDGGVTWNNTDLPSFTWVASFLNRDRVFAADRVNVGTFYAYHTTNGTYISTNGGINWTLASNTILNATAAQPEMRAVPGNAGHLWWVDGNTSGTGKLWRSQNGGTSWQQITAFSLAKKIGIGATANGASYPTLFHMSTLAATGVFGVYRSTDAGVTWVLIGVPPGDFPVSCQLDNKVCMDGDMNHYGRVYIGMNGSGGAYGALSGG